GGGGAGRRPVRGPARRVLRGMVRGGVLPAGTVLLPDHPVVDAGAGGRRRLAEPLAAASPGLGRLPRLRGRRRGLAAGGPPRPAGPLGPVLARGVVPRDEGPPGPVPGHAELDGAGAGRRLPAGPTTGRARRTLLRRRHAPPVSRAGPATGRSVLLPDLFRAA